MRICFYKILKAVCRGFSAFPYKVTGKENIPIEGSAIIAMNHRSNFDVPVAALSCKKEDAVYGESRDDLSRKSGVVFRSLGRSVHRGKGDIGAIKAALVTLKDSHLVAMFPEGKRAKARQRLLSRVL